MTRRLLIVDDDAQLVDSLRDILEDAGYAVFTVSTCAAAVAELKRVPIDLVLLDYNLPDGKGLAWAHQFQEANGRARILLMTGMAESDLPPTSGIHGFVPKPIAPPELLQRIHQALP